MEGGTFIVVVTVLYVLAMMLLSYFVGKKMTRDENEFMIGGREFSWPITAIGNTSILISGGYLPGIVMYGYLFGMGGMWFYLGWGTGALVALLTWAAFWRTSGAFTPTEWFEYRYGREGRMAISVVILVASLAIIGWQYVGSGAIIGGALGVSPTMGMLIVGIAVTLYVALGGVWAATITDTIQWTWVILTCFLVLPIYLIVRYGMPVAAALPDGFTTVPFGTLPVVKFIVPSVLTFLVQHQSLLNQAPYWTRSAGTRDTKAVVKGWTGTVIITYVVGVIGAFIGMYVRMLSPELETPSLALGTLLNYIPVPLAALIMAGLMAATMSTCDIYLVAGINQLVRDFAEDLFNIKDSKRLLNWARWGTVIYGFLAVIFAISWTRGLSLLFAFGTAIGAPLVIFYLDSWLLKVGNKQGSIATVIVALATVLYWEILTNNYQQVHTLWIVFPAALITLIVVSLATGGRKKLQADGLLNELDKKLLVALQCGYNTGAKLTGILAPYMKDSGYQSSDIHNQIEMLESRGLVSRESQRFTKQLHYLLTDEGKKEVQNHLSAEDKVAMEKYGVDRDSARILALLTERKEALGIDQLAVELGLYSLQLVAIIETLKEKGLINTKGFIRLYIEATGAGLDLGSNAKVSLTPAG